MRVRRLFWLVVMTLIMFWWLSENIAFVSVSSDDQVCVETVGNLWP